MKYIFIILGLMIAFAGGYFFSQKYSISLQPKQSIIALTPTPQPVVGNDRDSHGCVISAGYSWCDLKQKCLRTWEEPCQVTSPTPTVDETAVIQSAVKQQLVLEHGQSANSLTVSVTKVETNFARGTASEQGGGGIWLAMRVNGQWQLVFDGNGIPDCNKLKTTDSFPSTILTGICD